MINININININMITWSAVSLFIITAVTILIMLSHYHNHSCNLYQMTSYNFNDHHFSEHCRWLLYLSCDARFSIKSHLLSLSLFFTLSLSPTLSQSLTCTHTHSLSASLSHTLTSSLSQFPSHSISSEQNSTYMVMLDRLRDLTFCQPRQQLPSSHRNQPCRGCCYCVLQLMLVSLWMQMTGILLQVNRLHWREEIDTSS